MRALYQERETDPGDKNGRQEDGFQTLEAWQQLFCIARTSPHLALVIAARERAEVQQ